jgi:hypothetical protein
MPIIKMTQGDILRSKTVEAGWYGMQITKVHPPKMSKGGDSMNFPIEFTFLDGPAPGKTIDHYYNNKAMGMMVPVIQCAMGKTVEVGPDGTFEFDTDALLNKKVDAKIVVDTYEGSLINKIQEFLPFGQGKATQPF